VGRAMAAVIGSVVLFLATWLLTWALLMIVYFGVLAAVDFLGDQWRRYQRVRQYRRAVAAEVLRIDAETISSIERINSAFVAAQRLVRQEAAREQGAHR
jgi:biopolymer transport protein ExbB/TolQ